MKLPKPAQDLLLLARHLVARAEAFPPTAGPHPVGTALLDACRDGLTLSQPDRSSCGSSVIAMIRSMYDPSFAGAILDAPDPAARFGQEALAVRLETNGVRNQSRLQLPWPQSQGTRPAALIRYLRPWMGRLHQRVVDPQSPGRAWDAMAASTHPVPVYIGEGSWMQHIVLVTAATQTEAEIYEPAAGDVVTRTRRQFETARWDLAGWDQPWIVVL